MRTLTSDIHDIPDAPFGASPRSLTEDVLQSSQEAVLTNPASVDTLQGGDPEPEAHAEAEPADPGATRIPYVDRLAGRAAEKPVQSALLALAAGALLAALLKAALSRPRR